MTPGSVNRLPSFTEMAKYQVLVLPSQSDSEEEITGLRGEPGITGELKAHLQEIAQKDKTIREFAAALDNPSPEELFDACLFKYWVSGFLANLFQSTRVALGDYHPSVDKDWYRPFVAAICAWEEYNFRRAIGLPDVLATQDGLGSMAALKYSIYANIVMSGTKYPNFESEEEYAPKDA